MDNLWSMQGVLQKAYYDLLKLISLQGDLFVAELSTGDLFAAELST